MRALPDKPADLVPAPSIILALHSRYETIWDQHHLCDVAQPAKADCKTPADHGEFFGFEHAMERLRDEADAVRDAILFQKPENADQAAIFAYHADVAADEAASNPTQENCARVDRAVKTLFNFLTQHADPRLADTTRQYSRALQLSIEKGNYALGIGGVAA